MTDHHVETAPESAVVAPDAGRTDGRHPLDVLAEHEFVSRGDELVARRIARAVGEPDGWPLALLALAVRAAREGSSALDLTGVATTGAEVARDQEDEVDLAVMTLAEVIAVPDPAALADLVRGLGQGP